MVTTRLSASLYLVFEYMEHDLTGIASLPGVKFTKPQIKCYMHQLLSGLEYCHGQGVLHRDIKTSNLLIDDQGTLKIADFGLSTKLSKITINKSCGNSMVPTARTFTWRESLWSCSGFMEYRLCTWRTLYW